MDNGKNFGLSRDTDVDQVDAAEVQGWPADEPVLESINTTGICLYANIGGVEIVAYVSSFVHWFISSLVQSLLANELMNWWTNEPMN